MNFGLEEHGKLLRKFNPTSNEPEIYERELKALSLMGTFQSDKRDDLLQQYEYLFSLILDNKIQMTDELKARACEYAIMTGNL